MSKRNKIIATVCCIAVIGGAASLVVYRAKNKAAAPVVAQSTLAVVRTQSPQIGDIAHTSEFLGVVEPNEVVTVVPKVSGTVLKTYHEVGDTVKAGDLLFEIDPVDIQLSLNAAEAQLEANRVKSEIGLGSGYDGQVIQAKSALDSAQKMYNTARANLKDYEDENGTYLRLQEKEMNSLATKVGRLQEELSKIIDTDSPEYKDKDAELIAAEHAYEVARANFNAADEDDDPQHRALRTSFTNAQISYNSAKSAYDLVVGQSRDDAQLSTDVSLEAAEIGLEAQRKQLEYTRVYAPIDGVIEQKSVSEHQSFSVQSPAYYTVSNKSLMLVRFGVSESAVTQINVGDVVTLDKGGELFEGSVTEVATMVDPQSGLFTVKAAVDSGSVPLHTGSTVKITAQTERSADAVLVPIDSVYYDEGAAYVYTYHDGAARRTPVEIGITSGGNAEVTTGLTGADQVIVTWHPKLIDGATVLLEGETAASSAPSAPSASSASSASQQ